VGREAQAERRKSKKREERRKKNFMWGFYQTSVIARRAS
jgi:hypothetical protein